MLLLVNDHFFGLKNAAFFEDKQKAFIGAVREIRMGLKPGGFPLRSNINCLP